MKENTINLNDVLQLAGFRNLESSTMEVLMKNINNHARRIAELAENLSKIHITLKSLHEREKSEISDIHLKVTDGGKVYASHVTDRNIFVAVDKALQKVINEMD